MVMVIGVVTGRIISPVQKGQVLPASYGLWLGFPSICGLGVNHF